MVGMAAGPAVVLAWGLVSVRRLLEYGHGVETSGMLRMCLDGFAYDMPNTYTQVSRRSTVGLFVVF